MNMNRFAQSVTTAAGLLLLLAWPGSACGENAQTQAAPKPTLASPGPQMIGSVDDYFAGLDYSEEQKASIAKVHQNMGAKKALVAKDGTLDGDQKDAVTQGYTRLEYGEIFKLLTPVQQKLVRKRIIDARAANQGARRPAAPAPSSRP